MTRVSGQYSVALSQGGGSCQEMVEGQQVPFGRFLSFERHYPRGFWFERTLLRRTGLSVLCSPSIMSFRLAVTIRRAVPMMTR